MRTILLAMLVLAVTACPSRAELAAPPSPDAGRRAAFDAAWSDEALVILQEWVGLDLRFRARDQGISGEYLKVLEYRVQARSALEGGAIVWISDDPASRMKHVEVEVHRDGKVERHRRKDLRWFESTRRDNGVVTLDGTFAYALIPGLRVGDTVRVLRRWELKGTHGLGSWVLGNAEVPTLSSTFEVRVPEDYDLRFGETGSEEDLALLVHVSDRSDQRQIHRWSLEADADGLLPTCREAYPRATITPWIARAGSDHDESMAVGADWAAVGNAYLDRIGDVFAASAEIRDAVATLRSTTGDRVELIDRIYADVQSRCRYLGLFEGMGGVLPTPAAQVFGDGFGDCKGLGTLLISMLREAGIEAHPALVRTRSAGPLDTTAPNMAQFNHFIVWADDGAGGMFLDATVDRCPAGRVPDEDTLSPVLLLDPDRFGLVEIDAESWSAGELRIEIEGKLDAAGVLEVDIRHSYDGDAARWLRNRLAELGQRDRERWLQAAALPKEPPLVADATEVIGEESWREPVTVRAAAQSRTPLPGTGSNLLFPLLLTDDLSGFDPQLECGRSVDLRRRRAWRESWRIELPDELALARADTVAISAAGVLWSRRLWQDGSTLHLERTVDYADRSVTPEEAELIRDAVETARAQDKGYVALERRQE